MNKIEEALKLAKDCTYADDMTESAKLKLRTDIDEALEQFKEPKRDWERIEFPEIHSYMLDKEENHIYIDFYENVTGTTYHLLIDSWIFLDWIDSQHIAEIKENLIKTIEKK